MINDGRREATELIWVGISVPERNISPIGGLWSSGVIFTQGARGPGLNSQNDPSKNHESMRELAVLIGQIFQALLLVNDLVA